MMKLAFCIPAYNNPEYLYKCLKSLCSQKNKSFDILISDDCSPTDLQPIVNLINQEFHNLISIDYIKHQKNKGIYWNTRYVFERSNHQYKILFQHDDYVVDELFTQKILDIFEEDDKFSAIIFNAVTEFTGKKTFKNVKESSIDGKYFIANHLFKDIHPSYSSVVINTKFLDIKAYESTYISRPIAKKLRVEIDECFQILAMVAAESKVFISDNVATIRGEPNTSATQQNKLPFNTAAQGMLIAYYQLFKIMKNKGYKECAGEMARLLTHVFPSSTISWKLIKFFKYEIYFIKLHTIGIFIRNTRRVKRVIK
jgi:glycosyltransferase involved in cell wall biosynthesis